jgi:hypothetical protein
MGVLKGRPLFFGVDCVGGVPCGFLKGRALVLIVVEGFLNAGPARPFGGEEPMTIENGACEPGVASGGPGVEACRRELGPRGVRPIESRELAEEKDAGLGDPCGDRVGAARLSDSSGDIVLIDQIGVIGGCPFHRLLVRFESSNLKMGLHTPSIWT